MSKSWKVAQQVPTAADVIWQDPSSYDPFSHGPEYLPPRKVAKVAALGGSMLATVGLSRPEMALPAVLVMLRSLAMIHQTHHWCTSGESYYADHLLFERLYGGVVAEIDSVAERAVGTGSQRLIQDAQNQASAVQRVVAMFPNDGTARGMLTTSLEAEKCFSECVPEVVKALKDAGMLSRGTDNLLAGIEDKHEEHCYLLQQRLWKPV